MKNERGAGRKEHARLKDCVVCLQEKLEQNMSGIDVH